MFKLLISIIVMLLVVFMISCSGEKQAESKMETESETQTAVADNDSMATCPGCDMVMNKSNMVMYVADGDTLHFCSEECKAHYVAELEKEESE